MKPLLLGIAFLLPLVLPAICRGEDSVKIDDQTKKAVGRALEYLKTKQKKDGSWGQNTAITGFCLLAFMSDGNLPNQGPFAPEVSKGIRCLLASAMDDGYLVGNAAPNGRGGFMPGGNMYSHGMATLALSQAYGMSADDEVKKVLKKAIDLIVRSQNKEGGWRYTPTSSDADISVTIMQVMALRGAKDSGIHVPDSVIKKAVGYIEKCRDARTGGYGYMPQNPGGGFARTAAGVCVLQLAGNYESKDVERGIDFLEKSKNDAGHYWYGHYYAAHAFHQFGGKKWQDYYEGMKKKLLTQQKKSGEWSEQHDLGFGPEYQTSIAVLILNVPANYLPIYQR